MLESELRAKVAYVHAGNVIEANLRLAPPAVREGCGERLHVFAESDIAAQQLGQLTVDELSRINQDLVKQIVDVHFERCRLHRSRNIDVQILNEDEESEGV